MEVGVVVMMMMKMMMRLWQVFGGLYRGVGLLTSSSAPASYSRPPTFHTNPVPPPSPLSHGWMDGAGLEDVMGRGCISEEVKYITAHRAWKQ